MMNARLSIAKRTQALLLRERAVVIALADVLCKRKSNASLVSMEGEEAHKIAMAHGSRSLRRLASRLVSEAG